MKKIYKTPTVTIAISAYNEEQNIVNFINSVLDQIEGGFIIKEIWLHSDGSTDNTVRFVKNLKNKKIRIWDHKIRKGKSYRLNQIYRNVSSDFLVQMDADVLLAHKNVLKFLIKPLIFSKDVGMCSGNAIPLPAESYWEKVIHNSFEPYLYFRFNVRGGNNLFSAIGQLLAFRRDLIKKIIIPDDMVTNDIFTYFSCITSGWKYRCVKSAIVFSRSSMSIRDLINQNTRFHVGYLRIIEHFPKDLVDKEYSIPKLLKIKTLGKQFIRHPILSLVYFVVNIYCKFISYNLAYNLSVKWPIASSTKNLKINT